MSAAKESVNEVCRTPERANSSDARKKSRERKKKSLGPDFESSWPEDSTSESGTVPLESYLQCKKLL